MQLTRLSIWISSSRFEVIVVTYRSRVTCDEHADVVDAARSASRRLLHLASRSAALISPSMRRYSHQTVVQIRWPSDLQHRHINSLVNVIARFQLSSYDSRGSKAFSVVCDSVCVCLFLRIIKLKRLKLKSPNLAQG